jgi:hypothetical protein
MPDPEQQEEIVRIFKGLDGERNQIYHSVTAEEIKKKQKSQQTK